MPMYKEWQDDSERCRVAIWKIEEPEDFFIDHTKMTSDKKNGMRRLEHLAGRFLLQHAEPSIALDKIELSHLGKPFLPGNELFFSVSHSFPYIGVAIDHKKDIGIDVQVFQDKILRLQHKFLSAEEQAICDNTREKITLAWTAKEAAFKRYGLGAVDFIRHMPIREMVVEPHYAKINMEFCREHPSIMLPLHGNVEADFAWSVTT